MTNKTQNIQNQNLNILFKKLEQAFQEETTNFIRKGDTYYYIRASKDELKTVARARLTFKLKRKEFLEILEEIKQKFAEKNFSEEDINIWVRVYTYTEKIEVNANVCTGLDYSKVVKVVDFRDLTKEQYEEYLKELETLKEIVKEQEKIVAEKNNEIRKEKELERLKEELERLKEIENSYVKLKDENYKLKKIIQKLVDKEQLQEELAENEEDEEEEERELTKEEIEFILQKVL